MHPCSTRFRFTAPSAKVWLTLASIALTSALNTACASFGEREPVVPSLIGTLPETIASFQFDGYKHFDDSSGGFSFRYRNVAKKRLADVYVYPVAKQNAGLAHEELVLGSTRATIEAITEAVNQGHYANFDLLGAATRAQGARTTARVHATYLRDNLASFTMLYQSEHEGTLMKIRLSMPDNNSNRSNTEWDAFAERVFDLVIKDLDADLVPSNAAAASSELSASL
jgi:hypothetical protein